jgi:hypothetical protein
MHLANASGPDPSTAVVVDAPRCTGVEVERLAVLVVEPPPQPANRNPIGSTAVTSRRFLIVSGAVLLDGWFPAGFVRG